MNLQFQLTQRPDSSLLFKRNEAGDPRLGETVFTLPEDYGKAEVVLIGCPQDEGVRRNSGRVGAEAAPDEVRRCLYRLVAPKSMRLFDLGNTTILQTLEDTHAAHRRVVEHLLRDGKRVISLGGGNDIAYPDCAALSAVDGTDILVLNVDAHLDVRESPQRHSGTPYRQLLTEGLIKPRNFHETVFQPFAVAEAHLAYLNGLGAQTYSLRNVLTEGVGLFYRALIYQAEAKSIFWGIDMDAVSASDAPGVSAPNATGLSGDDLLTIAQIAGYDRRSRVFEVSEVNPKFDIDQRTCRLAAAAVWTFLDAVCSP